jgi:2-(1,2-epoxy-1,2-dihydrophenyl)acetyl-CoA isomerase
LIDRPERLNALNDAMKHQLADAFRGFAGDDSVRVVVIRGADRAFCSGADVSTMAGAGVPAGRNRLNLAHSIIRGIAHLEKPVIAAVRGHAVGIGWSIALACDYILATPEAKFGQVFKKVGLAPDGGSVFLLSQYVGVLRAKELVMSARIVSGDEAFRLGLVTELVADDQLGARVSALAADLAGSAGLALAMTKRLFIGAAGVGLDAFLELESHVQNQLLQTQDHQEGVSAFLDKRTPRFQGR